jgi:hypothetical protein
MNARATPVATALPAVLLDHPIFAPYRGQWPPAVDASPRLVPAPVGSAGALAFERAIVERDELHTRPADLHDALNAVVWRTFPAAKRAISERHVALGHDPASPNGRPRGRDVLTLFDEAGLLLVTPHAAALAEANARHEWQTLFIASRALWHTEIRPIVFGHGALEQMAKSFARHGAPVIQRDLTLKALWLAGGPGAPLAEIDTALARAIRVGELLSATEPRLPLPVIGIPGWFAESADLARYEDSTVFRSAHARRRFR